MERRDFKNRVQDAQRDECARAASALTALFDDEASAVEFVDAHTHLADCQACAGIFQTWKRNRFLLRSVPMPLVPAVLFTRVLLAVRLLHFTKSAAGTSLPSRSLAGTLFHAEARDSSLLAQTVMLSGANPFAARRRSDQTSRLPEMAPLDSSVPLPPAEMQSAILSRTVFAPETFAIQPESGRHGWNLRPALVPALAAFLMFFTGQVRQPEVIESSPAAAVAVERETPSKFVAPLRARRAAAATSVVEGGQDATPNVSVLPALAVVPSEPLPGAATPAVALPTEAFLNATLPFVASHIPAASQPAAFLAPSISSLSEPLHTRGALPGTLVTRHATSAPASAVQPTEVGGDDNAGDPDEVISHVARLSDERPDDVRDVVDEFRAALLAANPEGEDNPAES